jgi:hypothetical protein
LEESYEQVFGSKPSRPCHEPEIAARYESVFGQRYIAPPTPINPRCLSTTSLKLLVPGSSPGPFNEPQRVARYEKCLGHKYIPQSPPLTSGCESTAGKISTKTAPEQETSTPAVQANYFKTWRNEKAQTRHAVREERHSGFNRASEILSGMANNMAGSIRGFISSVHRCIAKTIMDNS